MILLSPGLMSQVQQEDLIIMNKEIRLSGKLALPEGVRKPPLVLIISGSGPTDLDGNNPVMKNNHQKLLAHDLASKGIASFRYNKRIIPSNNNIFHESDLRFEDFSSDAAACLEYLKKSRRFGKIYILGISEGSLIGMLTAQECRVHGFVSYAGAGFPIGNILVRQVSAQSEYLGRETRAIADSLEAGHRVKIINPLLMGLFRPDVQPYLISWMKYDPAEEIGKLKCPVLIVQGTTDIQVSLDDAERLHRSEPRSRLEVVEGMNHIMKKAPLERNENIKTYNEPELPLHPDLIKILTSFIKP